MRQGSVSNGETTTPAAPLTSELIQALTTVDGLEFCRFLRALYFEELRSGHVTVSGEPSRLAWLDRATHLGLLRDPALLAGVAGALAATLEPA